jgi:hypothetical protein
MLSAEQMAGARTPGKARGNIRHHGSQPGCVQLADRKVKVKRPRLRHKTEGEVKVPAHEMLRQCQCRDKTPAILPTLPILAAVSLGGDAVGTLQWFLHPSFSHNVVCFAQKLESLSISEETH